MKLHDVDGWNRRQCASWLRLYEYKVDSRRPVAEVREKIQDILVDEKAYLLNDAVFTPQENDIRAAVKRLMEATGGEVILAAAPENNVYVIPVILNDGMVEYQVSDGLPGQRTHSSDFYILAEAMAQFRQTRPGWHAAMEDLLADKRRRRRKAQPT
ncbi:MAG: hypothetical protein NT031_12840 [Planctomycetota bacterium]|nr:hypothetical protein [Planctomycetota bacterium]